MTRSFTSPWLTALLLATTAAFAPLAAHADAPDDPPEKILQNVLETHRRGAYKDFVALLETNDEGQVGITPEMFERMSNRLAPRLQGGWKSQYLGKLRQQGAVVHVWKVELTDGKDDLLVRMSLKDRKIATILLQ
jgi:hypothetical protein